MPDNNLAPVPELYAPFDRVETLKTEAADLVSWDLTPRQICDLELLMNGGFYPLTGFLNKGEYETVRDDMRLADGSLWPIPINLDVNEDFSSKLSAGQQIALRDLDEAPSASSAGVVWWPSRPVTRCTVRTRS